jgi:hypothetical protein
MAKGKKTEASGESQVTRAQILSAVEKLEAVVREWEHSSDEAIMVNFRGRIVRQLSQSIEQSAMELFNLCDSPSIEREAWPLVLAIDDFDDELQRFAERSSVAPDATDPHGGNSLWAAYGVMLKGKTPPRPHKIEPIAQLLAERVDRQQIAKIYGWRHPDGSPNLDKLQEEINEPGKHYDPATFVHPKDKKFWEGVEEKWFARVAAFEAGEDGQSRKVKPKKEAPESLDDLIIQGINAKQIAKMKHVDIDEVHARAAELGVALDSSTLVYASYADAQRAAAAKQQAGLQSALTIASINTHRDLGQDQDSRIRAMLTDGVAPTTVVEALKPQFPNLRHQDVAMQLNRMKREAAETAGATA